MQDPHTGIFISERTPRPKRSLDERTEQIAFTQWLKAHNIVYHSVPNNMSADAKTTSHFKQEGLVAGAPDLIVLSPRGVIAFEMKRESCALRDVSEAQWKMLEAYAKTPGAWAVVAFGFRVAVPAYDRSMGAGCT